MAHFTEVWLSKCTLWHAVVKPPEFEWTGLLSHSPRSHVPNQSVKCVGELLGGRASISRKPWALELPRDGLADPVTPMPPITLEIGLLSRLVPHGDTAFPFGGSVPDDVS